MARTVPVLRSSSHSERYTTQARSLQRVRRLGPGLHSERLSTPNNVFSLGGRVQSDVFRHSASHGSLAERSRKSHWVLNRIFNYLYAVRRVGKRLKAWHRPTYYIFKWILFGAIMVGLFATL
jgi:hypothetical protein